MVQCELCQPRAKAAKLRQAERRSGARVMPGRCRPRLHPSAANSPPYRRRGLQRGGGLRSFFGPSGPAETGKESAFEQDEGLWDAKIYAGGPRTYTGQEGAAILLRSRGWTAGSNSRSSAAESVSAVLLWLEAQRPGVRRGCEPTMCTAR